MTEGGTDLARDFPKGPPGPSAWRRLCPLPAWRDEVLEAVEAGLDAPEAALELARLEAEERHPLPAIERLRAVGLGSLFAEEEGADPSRSRVTVWHLAALNALAARRNASLAITLGQTGLSLLPFYVAGTDEQLRRAFRRVREGALGSLLLTEWDHGSNLLRNRARAERGTLGPDGGFLPATGGECTHYRLTGEKHLINGGARHDLLVALLRTREAEPGEERGPLAARADFTLLFVERDATVASPRRFRTLPATGADIAAVAFRGTVVPAANRLGREGEGFAVAQKALTISRGAAGAFACGASARARDLAFHYARRRDVYGAPIATQGAIAEHLLRLEAQDLLAAAASLKATALTNALGLGAAHYTAVAKLACCALAEEAVAEGRRVLGARALLKDLPYERVVRDVLLYGVFDGTSHVMLEQVAWRLAQQAANAGSGPPAPVPLGEAGRLLGTPPRRLVEACRGRAAPHLPDLEPHVRALAAVPGEVPLEPLVALARSLPALARALRSQKGRWDGDQANRFQAAEAFAHLEASIALVELCDPERRAALGLAPAEAGAAGAARDRLAYRFALGWFGARVVASLRHLALRAGLEREEAWLQRDLVDAGGLLAVERGFLAGHEAVRASLRERLAAG